MDFTLKNWLEQVGSKIGRDKLPEVNDLFGELRLELESIDREVTGLKLTVKKVNKESMDRRILLEKAEEDKGVMAGKLTDLQSKLDDSGNDKELETLRGFRKTVLTGRRSSFVSGFNEIKGHASFDKVKSEFVLPEPDGKGEYDFTKASEEDMDKNVSALDRLNRIAYFDLPGKKKVAGSTKITGDDLSFQTKVDAAKTPEDLRKLAEDLNS